MATYYSSALYQNALGHSGIHGMRWGHRRFQNLDRTWTEAGKERYGNKSSDNSKSKEKKDNVFKRFSRSITQNYKNKHPWLMSNKELEERTKRLELEKAYKEATRKEPTRARVFAANLMANIGTKIISGAVDRANAKLLARTERNNIRKKAREEEIIADTKHKGDLKRQEEQGMLANKLRLDYEKKSGDTDNAKIKDLEGWRVQQTKELEGWRNQQSKDMDSWRNSQRDSYDQSKKYADRLLSDLSYNDMFMTKEEKKEALSYIDSLYSMSAKNRNQWVFDNNRSSGSQWQFSGNNSGNNGGKKNK